MMNKEVTPWDKISIPKANVFHKQMVAEEMTIPCHWAKDNNGSLVFLIELEGSHELAYRKNLVKAQGIDIDLRGIEPNQQTIVLSLQKQIDVDLFQSFCVALIKALLPVKSPSVALEVIFKHINRWKFFLSGKKNLMSPQKIMGLFAELTFLNEVLKHSNEKIAVESWLGPEMSQHDFSFFSSDVEIKALGGNERNIVEISSEDQLFSLNENLYLRLYILGNQQDITTGTSLNQLVNAIRKQLQDTEISEQFLHKLKDYGYCPDVEYDKPAFLVRRISSFQVNEGFPRITKKALPDGISHVKYRIELDKIERFQCKNNKVFEVLNA